MSELHIKGSSLISKLAFLRSRFGAEAEQELRDRLIEKAQTQILEGSWYPFSLYDDGLRFIADLYFEGDLAALREVGAFSAEESLSTVYEIYSDFDFPRFLGRIGVLHKRFYDQGELSVDHVPGERACRIRMHGAPPYSEADLHVAAGFYIGAANHMGLENIRCRFETVDAEVHFRLDW